MTFFNIDHLASSLDELSLVQASPRKLFEFFNKELMQIVSLYFLPQSYISFMLTVISQTFITILNSLY